MDCREGIVRHVSSDHVDVLIVRASACSECHAKHLCNSSEMKEQMVRVPHPSFAVAEGERVRIVTQAHSGLTAVLYAFVVPLVLLLAVTLYLSADGTSEGAIAAVAVSLLVGYALLLRRLNPYFTKKFTMAIEPLDADRPSTSS